MSIITINIANKNFKLHCSPESREYVENLADKLDHEVLELKKHNPGASLEMLFLMKILDLLDHRDNQEKISGGKVLAEYEQQQQAQLTQIHEALKKLANKMQNC